MGLLYSTNNKKYITNTIENTDECSITRMLSVEQPILEENTDECSIMRMLSVEQPILEEKQYIDSLEYILKRGYDENSVRNGKIRYIFGEQTMRFSLENGKLPLLTTKQIEWKNCIKEILWFINECSNNYMLIKEDNHIWDLNTIPKYSELYNINKYIHKDESHASNKYRTYNRSGSKCFNNFLYEEYKTSGTEQLCKIIDILKSPDIRSSNKIFMTSLNIDNFCVNNITPNNILCHFFVSDGDKLSCAFYQRSSDSVTGKPFNIATYAILTHLLAIHCELKAHELICYDSNCHIYESNISIAKKQSKLKPFSFPTIKIVRTKQSIKEYTIEDFIVLGYKYHYLH